jgi:hypothetical protein
MPWRQMPMKDVGHCDKPREAVNKRYIRGSPNEETYWCEPPVSVHEYIVYGREPRELKHLSTARKRDHSPSSGERTGNSLNRASLLVRGCRVQRLRVTKRDVSRIGVEKPTIEGDSPVNENVESLVGNLSTTGHANPVGI